MLSNNLPYFSSFKTVYIYASDQFSNEMFANVNRKRWVLLSTHASYVTWAKLIIVNK